MAITYAEVYRRTRPWGIDVDVEFTDDSTGGKHNKKLRFEDEAEITAEFDSRCSVAASNLLASSERDLNSNELVKRVIDWYDGHATMAKAQWELFINETLPVKIFQ